MFRLKQAKQALALFICFTIVLYSVPIPVFAEESLPVEPNLVHEGLKTVTAGERTTVLSQVSNAESVKAIDLYFRDNTQSEFAYVPMDADKGESSTIDSFKTLGSDKYGQFKGVLPAAAATTPAIEYLFVVTTKSGEVFRSSSYFPTVGKPTGLVTTHASMPVYSPFEKAPLPAGFDDNIHMIKATDVPGVSAGLYPSIAAAAAVATYGTYTFLGVKVAATTLPWSTMSIVAGTAAVVGVVAVTALAVGGGGGGGSSSSSSSSNFTTSQLVGTYAVYDGSNQHWSAVFMMSSGGSLRTQEQIDGTWYTYYGSWSFNEATQVLTIHAKYNGGMTGTISGIPKSFTLSGSWISGGSVNATFERGG